MSQANSKPWWESRTMWLNLLALAATAVGAMNEMWPMLEHALPPAAYLITGFVVAVANIILRAVTDQPVRLK